MRRIRRGAVCLLVALLPAGLWAQTFGPVPDPGVVTTQQVLSPAGVSLSLNNPVHGVAFSRDGTLWVQTLREVLPVAWERNEAGRSVSVGTRSGFQSLYVDPNTGRPWIGALQGSEVQLRVLLPDNEWLIAGAALGSSSVGSFAVAPYPREDGVQALVVPLTAQNQTVVLNVQNGKVLARPQTGQAPFAAVIGEHGLEAWVSHWGGRFAVAGESRHPKTPLAVDARGIVARGHVMRLDMTTYKVTDEIETGLHPTALIWDERRGRLYVSDSNSDSISVIDTQRRTVEATWPLRLGRSQASGIIPSALALSPEGDRLYVACAGVNGVAVVDADGGAVLGWIPTGWYPASLAIDHSGSHLAVGSLLGPGTGGLDAKRRTVSARRGMVNIVPVPDSTQLQDYTTAVLANNRQTLAEENSGQACSLGEVIPRCLGDPSPIEHVVLVIKENRTYDSILGDLGRGNGDKTMTLFGRRVTPNQHLLAEQFITLDNYYATGEVSTQGHTWLTQGYAPSYVYWPGYEGRSYPFDGSDPLAYSPNGFLWDLARARGRSVQVFGEMVPAAESGSSRRSLLLEEWRSGTRNFRGRWKTVAQLPTLNEVLVADYPAYDLGIPDVVRVEVFLDELRVWESAGTMPNLSIVLLPSNHTVGVSPGWSTPAAMAADNDLALGKMVEGLSHSSFWKRMAIFVVEDDAQDGADHVDGHRTVAQVISPYTRRGAVDSTFYTHQSILKTIELILGLPTMSLFDLIATDMRNCFKSEADETGYSAVQPDVSLHDTTPGLAQLRGRQRRDAESSARMNFAVPDAAPWGELNRILWRAAKGEKAKYPGVRAAAFRPLMVEEEEEEDEEGKRR